ncbi:hypothetical protein GCM10010124_15600 [Pilimelia terevasa]|uniref:Ketoreductase domain-containing protein n=1 Tax=Pilimelia terevasa TaxID=53372 RepID=A0A8J3FI54_9ACTN|nr:SDR family NAD(P)-dependent oxidoreductase [Pilimelia terevasa]GGK23956.1 hypothetical protein GCM10010124_15600 [Pilimelia terevasa]
MSAGGGGRPRRVAVVTGGSSGVGRATAVAFARRGWAVVLAGRDGAALAEVAARCGPHTLAVPTDVTDAAAVVELAERAAGRFGRLDLWVNNAAVATFGSVEATPVADVRRVVEVNVLGYLHGVRAALPWLRAAGGGTVVNIASAVGVLGHPSAAGYAMSRFAVRGLSASVRQELLLAGERRIRVCTVLPSSIDTPLYGWAGNYSGRTVAALPPVYPPARVALRVLRLADRPRRTVYVGAAGHLAALANRCAPAVVDRLYVAWTRRRQLTPPAAPPTAGNLYAPRHRPPGAAPAPPDGGDVPADALADVP